MTLPKQTIAVTLREGIDTKTSQRASIPGRLVELENGVFTKSGEIQKRRGYDRIVAHVENGAAIAQADGLATFRDELLCFGENGRVFSLSGALDRWLDRGSIVSVGLEERHVVRNSNAQSVPDVARAASMSCVAWEDTRGGVRYSIVDDETGVPLVSDALVTATGTRPKILSFESAFFIFYSAGAALFYKRIAHNDPTTLGTEQNPIPTLDAAAQAWDVNVVGTRIYVIWQNNTATARYGYFSSAMVFVDVAPLATADAVAVWGDTSNNAWLLYSGAGGQNLRIVDSGSATLAGPVVVGSLVSPTRISGVAVGAESRMLFEASGSVVHTAACTLAGTVTTATVLLRSVGLAGRPFSYGGANVYVPVVHDSALQATLFVVDAVTGKVIAKASPGMSGGARSRNTVSGVVSPSTGKYTMAATVVAALESDVGGVFTRDGVELVDLDFTAAARYLTAELGNNLHIAGGVLHVYDGVTLAENGFHVYPEGIAAPVIAGGAGAIEAGAHQWRFLYEWTDGQGQVHRSAPSPAVSFTTALNDRATFTIPTLRITGKSQVRVVVFRTVAAGTVFYRLNAIATPLLNDTAADSVSYADSAADSTITGNELLYSDGTAGQELENIAPGASAAITSHRGRVFLTIGPRKIAYSKQVFDGDAVAFSDSLYLLPDQRGGKVTALASMDDKLVIFKEHAIFFTAGDGPNNAGSGDYPEPVLVTSDVGCTEVRSVVLTNAGVMFKSSKGIYLLDRSMNVTYIGANVEDWNSLTVTSATLVPNTNEVRFTTSGSVTIGGEVKTGIALVYDYVFNQWSTFTNHDSADATVWQSSYVRVQGDGKVYKENRSVYTDDLLPVKLRLVTSWLPFAGVSGFQRVSRVLTLGEFKSQHSFRVRLGYDYRPEWDMDETVNATTALGVGTWGSDTAWGTGAVWGGYYPSHWFRVQPNNQKCSAIRVSIEDSQTSDYGEGYNISSLAFQVGLKSGANKLAASRGI